MIAVWIGVVLAASPAAGGKPMKSSAVTAPWKGPYGGVPPFDAVTVDQFAPGIELGMAEARKAIDVIAKDKHPATFENTIAALERCDRMLNRVATLYSIWGSTCLLYTSPSPRD